jgi:fermentation-respiration switch protein FrsA (DUF1100 family)
MPVARELLADPPAPRAAAGGARSNRRVLHLGAEERIFGGYVIVIAVHLAAVGLLFPGRVGPVARIALLLCAAIAPPVLVWLFVRNGRGVRFLLAAVVGLCATGMGLATSVPHAMLTGAAGGDFTGILATAAGIALMALAFRVALRGRRLLVKLALGVVACFVVGQWLIAPAINVGVITNAPRTTVASANTLGLPGARDVSFPARDGVRLVGWYVPSRNGTSVILLHGSHGTRADTLAHLRMLVAAGYGVLAYDARGHGQSAGQTNALGWQGAQDLAGAVSFLNRQNRLDRRRIAALGLSMGGEEALRAAATGVSLSAIIADGAGASTLADNQLVPRGLAPVFTSVTWLTMRGTELLSGDLEPAPLTQIVHGIHVPVLLIASNKGGERAIDQVYRDRIGADASLWHLSDVEHTDGLNAHPLDYAARVRAFLAAALAGR